MAEMMRGKCLCGKITFAFSHEPIKITLCHCSNCKRVTGTAYSTNITIPSSSFHVTGSPQQFEFDSGQGPIFTISFCGTCSSTMWKESNAEGFKGFVMIQAGTLGREFDSYSPNGEIFTEERSRWLEPLKDAKQFSGTDVVV